MNASPPCTNPILRVAVPTPVRRYFDYLAPTNSNSEIGPQVGARVLVPFGTRTLQGVIVEITDHSEIKELKAALEILDVTPLFTPQLIELFIWASNYYHYPLGMIFAAVIPAWLRKHVDPVKQEIPATSTLRVSAGMTCSGSAGIHAANSAQQHAIDLITQNFNKFSTFLLDGVTGSGKTEVYMQLIAATIAQNKQALILVPEINLTPQTLQRFQERFNVPIALLHSQVTEKQRAMHWLQAQQGLAPIVLGTRLAAFTPLKNPGIFIIDEEHDLSFKQQERFRYSARDLLLKRAQLEQCPVVLGTATPSLESWHNVQNQRFQHVQLPERAGEAQMPSVEIIDIRHKQLDAGLSNHLLEQIKQELALNNQVLLFINRRGYAPVVMCCNCGWHQVCKRCDSNMIYHAKHNALRCHHCAAQSSVPNNCPQCQATITFVGLGTQRIEECLTQHFPQAKIARVDKDSASTKNQLQKILDQVQDQSVNILIGTQMLAKGHHFPNLTLVAIVDIDSALFSADFRATERIGQLLTQVAGRTGRSIKPGKVILQTTQPDHPVLSTLLRDGYHAFIDQIYAERKSAQLPPYSYQVLFRAETKTPQTAQKFLNTVKGLITQTQTQVTCLGPIPAPMEKRQGNYRAQLLLQAPQRKFLQAALDHAIAQIEADKSTQRIRWTVDVDPLEMY